MHIFLILTEFMLLHILSEKRSCVQKAVLLKMALIQETETEQEKGGGTHGVVLRSKSL